MIKVRVPVWEGKLPVTRNVAGLRVYDVRGNRVQYIDGANVDLLVEFTLDAKQSELVMLMGKPSAPPAHMPRLLKLGDAHMGWYMAGAASWQLVLISAGVFNWFV